MTLQRAVVVSSSLLLAAGCGAGVPEQEAPAGAPGLARSTRASSVVGAYQDNAVYLSHAYVTTASYIQTYTDEFLTQMQARGVRTVYLNIGTLDATGRVPSSQYPQLALFLDRVRAWEVAHGHTFQLFAWLSGSLDAANANRVDISTAAGNDRAALLSECQRFLSASVQGSYVAGAQRELDGVQLDLEPSGPLGTYPGTPDDTNFNNWKTLMQELRTQLNAGGLGHKLTGVAAHKWGDSTARRWYWPQRYFYYMGRYVNQIALMSYNSASTSEAGYEAWMENNARQALRSLSGAAYGNPSSYPPPSNGVKLYTGFPAYPASTSGSPRPHDPAYETVPAAARGADAAVSALVDDASDASEDFFGGASMYLHTDGYSTPGTYARYDTEWAAWNQWWLGQ